MLTLSTVRSAVLVVSLAGLGAVGCSSASEGPGAISEPETAAEIPAGATGLTFDPVEEVSTPLSAIVERQRLVIRDAAAWAAFWDEFAARVEPRPDPPAVDFTTHMVIAATMGQKTSGGHSISVEEVAEKDGTMYARVLETSPGVSCVNITVMTAPAVAVVVPRHDGTVAFVEEELALPCTP